MESDLSGNQSYLIRFYHLRMRTVLCHPHHMHAAHLTILTKLQPTILSTGGTQGAGNQGRRLGLRLTERQ